MQNYYDNLIKNKHLPEGWNLVGTGYFRYYHGKINSVPGDVETKYSIGELIKVLGDKCIHATRIFIMYPKVSTVVMTREGYRGKGLFSEARELVENEIIPRVAKTLGWGELIFEVVLSNEETAPFLKEWFKKRGYREEGENILKKILRI